MDGFGASDEALVFASDGNIGVGTNTPNAPIGVSNDETVSYFRIPVSGVRTNLFAAMMATEAPLGTGEFQHGIVNRDGPGMRLNANGNRLVERILATGGPTCAA